MWTIIYLIAEANVSVVVKVGPWKSKRVWAGGWCGSYLYKATSRPRLWSKESRTVIEVLGVGYIALHALITCCLQWQILEDVRWIETDTVSKKIHAEILWSWTRPLSWECIRRILCSKCTCSPCDINNIHMARSWISRTILQPSSDLNIGIG